MNAAIGEHRRSKSVGTVVSGDQFSLLTPHETTV